MKEAENLNFIDGIIDKKNIDGFTPLYILCEQGFRKKEYEDSEEEELNEALDKLENIEDNLDGGDGL